MRCPEYRRFWLGETAESEFDAHCRTCEECGRARALDERIAREAAGIPVPVSAPGVWERIAAEVRRERRPASSPAMRRLRRVMDLLDPRRYPVSLPGAVFSARHLQWKFAAVLAVVVGIGAFHFLRPSEPPPQAGNLLSAEALARVERLEAEYERAIADLEATAQPVIAASDVELALRYRDRLETIDAQIRRCREVLEEDGANAHVRRYLMAAYRDKKETLIQLLALAES